MSSSTGRRRPSVREMSTPARLSLLSRGTPRMSAAMSRMHARAYRLTRGRGLGRWFGVPLIIMETVGRRSGQVRQTPVIYIEDGDDVVVLAANAGSDRMPAWWLNLEAAGHGALILHGDRREVVPRRADGEERERLWKAFARVYPAIDEYTTFTDRQIPVVMLSDPRNDPPG